MTIPSGVRDGTGEKLWGGGGRAGGPLPGCGAAPDTNSMLRARLMSVVVAAVAVTMVYLGYDPAESKPPAAAASSR